MFGFAEHFVHHRCIFPLTLLMVSAAVILVRPCVRRTIVSAICSSRVGFIEMVASGGALWPTKTNTALAHSFRAALLFASLVLIQTSALAQVSISSNTPGTISTFVRFAPPFIDGALATVQAIGIPRFVAAARDAEGGFYLSSPEQNRVYRVFGDGRIAVVAGSSNGLSGDIGDGGKATAALLNSPTGIAVDGAGNLLIADAGNMRIRKVYPSGIITAVPVTLPFPRKLSVDAANNLYAGDALDKRILQVSPTGSVAAIATDIALPDGFVADSSASIYVADTLNNRVLKVAADRTVSIIAGTGTPGFSGDGGPAALARLNHPEDVALDAQGNLYIADYFNNAIRKIGRDGIIYTVAGIPGEHLSAAAASAVMADLQ